MSSARRTVPSMTLSSLNVDARIATNALLTMSSGMRPCNKKEELKKCTQRAILGSNVILRMRHDQQEVRARQTGHKGSGLYRGKVGVSDSKQDAEGSGY